MSARLSLLAASAALLAASAALVACGGVTVGGAQDGGGDASMQGDAGVDGAADACPLPKEPTFDCDAATPSLGTCNGPLPGNLPPSPHPVGCVVYLPTSAPFCGGACCGPQPCNCEQGPGGPGPQWLCPL